MNVFRASRRSRHESSSGGASDAAPQRIQIGFFAELIALVFPSIAQEAATELLETEVCPRCGGRFELGPPQGRRGIRWPKPHPLDCSGKVEAHD